MINIIDIFLDFYFTRFLFGVLAFYGAFMLFKKLIWG